jgi:hypothetical protein
MRKRLEGRDHSLLLLKEVRSLGELSGRACSEYLSNTIRCTFWLWEHEGTYRGIQVDISARFDPREVSVTGTHVFAKNEA